MKAKYVRGEPSMLPRITPELHKMFPRSIRKALRYTKPNAVTVTFTNGDTDRVVSDWLAVNDPMHEARYYCTNTVDSDFDLSSSAEFADIDDDYADLTEVEAMDEVALWRFCTGYDVL